MTQLISAAFNQWLQCASGKIGFDNFWHAASGFMLLSYAGGCRSWKLSLGGFTPALSGPVKQNPEVFAVCLELRLRLLLHTTHVHYEVSSGMAYS